MWPERLTGLAKNVIDACRDRGLMIATAESCTGGLIVACLTEVAGSSAVVERGLVTYSNEAKQELLGVPADMLERHGAVSEPVAKAMAVGALERSRAQLTVAVTGIAGPSGGSGLKPVGLVHLATAIDGGEVRHREERYGDHGRLHVRVATVGTALAMLHIAAQDWKG